MPSSCTPYPTVLRWKGEFAQPPLDSSIATLVFVFERVRVMFIESWRELGYDIVECDLHVLCGLHKYSAAEIAWHSIATAACFMILHVCRRMEREKGSERVCVKQIVACVNVIVAKRKSHSIDQFSVIEFIALKY